jgi:PqqD family protein of HPr-rel-A system
MNWYCEVFKLLLVRNWEDEFFLYNPRTTHTHILNALGWQVLCACAEAPVPQHQLLEELSQVVHGDSGNPDPEQLAETLNAHLVQLSQLGLLEGSDTLATC